MKLQVSIATDGLVFTSENKAGKLSADKEKFLDAMPVDNAVNALKAEVNGRENVTRAALSALVVILNNPALDGYKGQGNIADGTSLPKALKEGMRNAEREFFQHAYKQADKLDAFLSGLRDAGIYATVKGVALKYFHFAGRLPCAYEGDHPNTAKLLSVSAMQKLLTMMQDDKPEEDKTLAGQVLRLHGTLDTRQDWSKEELERVKKNLYFFMEDVQQRINTIIANDTDAQDKAAAAAHASAVLVPQPASLDDAIAAELSRIDAEQAAWDKEPTEEEAPF